MKKQYLIALLVFILSSCGDSGGGGGGGNNLPQITLLGDSPTVLLVGETYNEAGATATDMEDGDISNLITINGNVDTATVGEYVKEYTVEDNSGNPASAIRKIFVVNSTRLPLAKYAGTANLIDFNGANHVVVANDTALNITDTFTIEAWIRADQINGEHGIAGTWDDLSGGLRTYLFWIWNNNLELLISRNGQEFPRASFDISDHLGEWIHVAGTYDGTDIKLYVNGELKATTNLPGQVNTNTQPFYIGRSESGSNGTDYFTGAMLDLRLWNVARNEQEIRTNMSQRQDNTTTGLVANWPMDGGFGTQITEIVNGLNGTLSADAWVTGNAPGIVQVLFGTQETIVLSGEDFSGLGGNLLVQSLPGNGRLFQVNALGGKAEEITQEGTQVNDVEGRLIYEPNTGYMGGDRFGIQFNNALQQSSLVSVEINVWSN